MDAIAQLVIGAALSAIATLLIYLVSSKASKEAINALTLRVETVEKQIPDKADKTEVARVEGDAHRVSDALENIRKEMKEDLNSFREEIRVMLNTRVSRVSRG